MEVKFWANKTDPDGDKKLTYLLMDLVEYGVMNGVFLMAKDSLTAAYIVNEYTTNGPLCSVDLQAVLGTVREEKYNSLRLSRGKDGRITYTIYLSREFLSSEGFEQWMRDSFQGTELKSDWKEMELCEDPFFMLRLITDERCSTVDKLKEIKGKPYTEINLDSVRVFSKISLSGKYHEISKELEMRNITDLIEANARLNESGASMGVCVLESVYQYYETWLRLFR